MRKRTRLALLLAAGAVALATAGAALASFNPRITVTAPAAAGGTPVVTLDVRVDQADDPTAKVTIYVPPGYQVSLPAVGTKLGTVDAHAQAADLGGAVLPLTGDLLVADPKSGTLPQAAVLCLGAETAVGVWNLHLTAAGQVLDVPIFVVQTTGAEAALAQFKLVVCLPPPDVPPGTPGRATFGAKLLDATFSDSALTAPSAPGEYRWRTIWTPYTPNTGKANPAGTKEAQSIVRVPTALTLSVKKSKVIRKTSAGKRTWTRLTITGKLTENLAAIPGRAVVVQYSFTASGGLKSLGTATTSSAGTFTRTLLVNKTTYVLARATIPARDLGATGCTPTNPAVPCNDATIGGTTVASQKLRVTAFRFK
jgi:hypothetical protein